MARRKQDGLYRRNGIFGFRFKDAAGSWREKSTGKADREAAKTFKNDFLNDLKNGTLPSGMADWTLEQAKNWWLEFRKPRIAGSTLEAEKHRLTPLVRTMGNIRLKQITNVVIDGYVTKRLENGIGAWSINKEILTWSMILKKSKALASH